MTLEHHIQQTVQKAVADLYRTQLSFDQIVLQETRKEFEGQMTLVTFSIIRFSKKSPEQTGLEIGEYLKKSGTAASQIQPVTKLCMDKIRMGRLTRIF